MSGPYTIAEAREKNAMGTATGGCWRCIQNARIEDGVMGRHMKFEDVPTQWKAEELRFIGHRQFCLTHYYQELQGERDF